ncbi:hypothetical protein [Desulfopila aestuarii]|uniref:Uncharacterized protein n=1 Tax=Desulfopila aestuarii DSM 18488 TaxID=1121416 RepID=A0A1M7YJP6_9BACT|nr:hypothetical protein [Desulfopila aestuarii]SHO52830.1 hypothetical protein SAMN02745220_04790 [Desulfopila aestuarii DSM 18488]
MALSSTFIAATLPAGIVSADLSGAVLPLLFSSACGTSNYDASALFDLAPQTEAVPKYPPAFSTTYVKHSTAINSGYSGYMAINPGLSLTGSPTNCSWLSYSGVLLAKLVIDYVTPFVAKSIYLEAYHNSGTSQLDNAVKDFAVYGSNSSVAMTNYNNAADTTGLIYLGSFEARRHITADVSDPQYFDLSGNTTAYRYYVVRTLTSFSTSYVGIRHIAFRSELYTEPWQRIIVRDAAENILSCTIEEWDTGLDVASLYVEMPEISATQQTLITIDYDAGNADNSENMVWTGTAPAAPESGDDLVVWNLAVADELFSYTFGFDSYIYAALLQRYDLAGATIAVAQPYGIAVDLDVVELEQLYSMLMEIWLMQLYGDVPLLAAILSQPYRGANILQKELLQKWGAALELETGLVQPWTMAESLDVVSEQIYGIAAAVLQVTSEQLYAINDCSTLFTGLVQPYAMAAETAALFIFDTKIYVDGERIPYITCEWQATKSEYAWHVDFSVKSLEVAIRCADGADIVIVSAGDTYRFRCYEGWKLDKRYLETVYRIEAWSPTRALDLAAPLVGDLSGMASVIASDLAAPHGITVDWQMADGFIRGGKLTANNETPLAVIRKLVEDGNRGRVQTAADGMTLLCVCGTETPIPDWPTVTPFQVIDARIERRSTTWQNEIQPGHNSFIVSDQLPTGNTEQLIDRLIDHRTADVRVYVTPLADAPGYTLEHSGGASVSIEPMGVVGEVVVDELVAIDGGIGKTRWPIYGVVDRVWREQQLGDIVTSEDGIIQADIAGYSLLRLSYTTRFYQWLARDNRIEEVQFIARRAD